MSQITRATARAQIQRLFGEFITGTSDASGNTTTKLVDTDMGAYKSNWFDGKWVYYPSTDETRLIDTWTNAAASNGTWTGVIAAALQSTAYELSIAQPSVVHNELDNAIDELFPYISRPVADYVVGGCPLKDPFFQAWSSATALQFWTKAGTGAVLAQVLGDVTGTDPDPLVGATLCKLTNGASNAATLGQYLGIPAFGTLSVTAYALVWCSTASRVTLDIIETGTTVAKQATHTGTGWELLTFTYTLAAGAASQSVNNPKLQIAISSGTAISCYPAVVWYTAGQVFHQHRLFVLNNRPGTSMDNILSVARGEPMPTTLASLRWSNRSPSRVWRPAAWGLERLPEPGGTTIDSTSIWLRQPVPGCVYRIMGLTPIHKPTTEADSNDSMELDQSQAAALYASTAIRVIDRMPAALQVALAPRRGELARLRDTHLARLGSPLYTV